MTKIYSVSQINRYIKNLVKEDVLLSSVFIRGEISNLKYHTSGHIYFSLKDNGGTISCIMFSAYARTLKMRLRDGDNVVVSGYVDVYEAGGKYQLYARAVQKEGAGELYERFLRLKAELEEMGMFDPLYKKPIPKYALRIGVVTASTGAAVRDIEQISRRRNPYVQLFLYPAQVQGEGASRSIAEGIRFLDELGLDVLIVGRGGGSIEDLWAFNEEITARAIFECRTPVISAVGHETDTTIADYAADLRAPTPSAAAEIAVFDFRSFLNDISVMRERLQKPVERSLSLFRARADHYGTVLRLRSPERLISDQRMKCADLEDAMRKAMENAFLVRRENASVLHDRISRAMLSEIDEAKHRCMLHAARIDGLSPLKRLMQGFSYTADQNGRCIRSVRDVSEGRDITVYVSDGKIYSTVSGTENAPRL